MALSSLGGRRRINRESGVLRWGLGLAFLGLAVLSWVGSLIISPYRILSGEEWVVRAHASNAIVAASLICLVSVLASALAVYWKEENRQGWKAIAFAIPLFFFGGTALARFVYVRFYVLG